MEKSERLIIERVIKDAIAAGYTLSVFDGEETTVRKSVDFQTVIDAMASTDEDVLTLHGPLGMSGSISLVYGNEPGVVISNYHESLEPFLAPINAWSESQWG